MHGWKGGMFLIQSNESRGGAIFGIREGGQGNSLGNGFVGFS